MRTIERKRHHLVIRLSLNGKARCTAIAARLLSDGSEERIGINSLNPVVLRERETFVRSIPAPLDEKEEFMQLLTECAGELEITADHQHPTSLVTERNRVCTDLGNAERFVEQHGDRIRYVPHWDKVLILEGARWKPDEMQAHYQLACETVRALWKEAADADDSNERAQIAKHAKESERESRISALLKIAKTDPAIVVEPEKLDSDQMLFGALNGVVDLRTGELRAMRPTDLITRVAGAPFDPSAQAPRWRAYLKRVLANDEELEHYLQRVVGYALTGDVSEQVFFFLYGLGANGKSVFLSVLRWLFADYAATADSATFLARNQDGPRTDLARLEGARLVTAMEAGENRRLDEELIKKITGGDVITARKLYHAEREFTPRFKLLFSANHKPIVRGSDHAMWRRVQLIPFTVTIPEGERNPHLADELRDELPGILAWAVEGCLLWIEQGLRPPARVVAAVAEYRTESDTIGRFIEECCDQDPTVATPSKAIYARYTAWADSVGEHKLSANMLGRKLKEKGFESENLGERQLAHRLGLRLRPESNGDPSGPSSTVDVRSIPEHSRGLFPESGISSPGARIERNPKQRLNALERSENALTPEPELLPEPARTGPDHG